MARGIRDNERNARAELVVVEEGSEPSKLTDVSLYLFCHKLFYKCSFCFITGVVSHNVSDSDVSSYFQSE